MAITVLIYIMLMINQIVSITHTVGGAGKEEFGYSGEFLYM